MTIKVFDRWGTENITVQDPGLKDYIELQPRVVPRTGARWAGSRFHKSKTFIVERLINKVMTSTHKSKKHFIQRSGSYSGKGLTATKAVYRAFEIIESATKENPVKVFVQAIENAAPREEIITIEYGGARYPKAVECAPQRRVDISLRLMTQASAQKAFNSKKSIENALADEILNAYKSSQQSFAVSKKIEVERQADSSR